MRCVICTEHIIRSVEKIGGTTMAKAKFGSALALVVVIAYPQFSNAQSANTAITFTKDIAPILEEKCQACHRPDSMAPMSLVTYEDVRPWAKAIRERVLTRQMPPWHIDKTVGIQKFKNDRSLSDAQIDTIVKWVDAGAPKGDPKDMPPPKQWPDESKWQLATKYGQPDLVVKSAPYTIPAAAQDAWWRPVSDTGLTEPRWVRAIEI